MVKKEMERIIAVPGILSIDQYDFDALLDGGEPGYLSKVVNSAKDFKVTGLPNYVDSLIVYIETSHSMKLFDVEIILEEIRSINDKDINIIYGSGINESIKDKIQVNIFYRLT